MVRSTVPGIVSPEKEALVGDYDIGQKIVVSLYDAHAQEAEPAGIIPLGKLVNALKTFGKINA